MADALCVERDGFEVHAHLFGRSCYELRMSPLTINVRAAKTSDLITLLVESSALRAALSPGVDPTSREVAEHALGLVAKEIDRRVPVPAE